MARGGRKRRVDVDRYPGGQIRRPDDHSPTLTKRLVTAALAGMADPQWGTIPGQFYLSGKISDTQYEASRRFSAVMQDYALAFLGPAPPRTSTGERGSYSAPVDPDTEEGEREAMRHMKANARYVEARRALTPQVEHELCKFCGSFGHIPSYQELILIKNGLDALVCLWRITTHGQ